jgi:o-succinylbenzoate---CoA ligase
MTDWLYVASSLFNTKDYILIGEKTLSFLDIDERAVSLSQSLHNEYGLKRGDIVAIISENNIEFILLIFALWKSGALPVPLNIRLNESETDTLIKFLNPTFIYIDQGFNKQINYPAEKIIYVKEDYLTSERISIIPDIKGKDTALILFTSGTSGSPKGVELTFNNLKASFDNSNTILQESMNDKWIASLPFYHIGGFSIIIRALLSGASLIIPQKLDVSSIADSIVRMKPTLLSLVSTQLRRLIELGIKPNAGLRHVLLGGGYIDSVLLDQAINDGWPIIKVYGSTETSSLVTYVDCNNDVDNNSSVGIPLANNQIFIVNERKELLPPKAKGEIAVRSDSCAKGYYKNSDATKVKFKHGLYYTGDTGFIDEKGYLYIDSRSNDLIISGGENINPLEVEAVLLNYPGVQNVSVFGVEDKEWGHIVSAAIILKPGINTSENELRDYLVEKISTFKIPRIYYFMDEFPISPLGKVQKEKLKEIIKNY